MEGQQENRIPLLIGVNYMDCSINGQPDSLWEIIMAEMNQAYQSAIMIISKEIEKYPTPESYFEAFVKVYSKILEKPLIFRSSYGLKREYRFWINYKYFMYSCENPNNYTDDEEVAGKLQEFLDYCNHYYMDEQPCGMIEVLVFTKGEPWFILYPEDLK